jgi:oligosaccharide repeat unit polymerase
MIFLFNILTFIYLTVWLVPSIKQILKGDRSPFNFVMCVFYVFFGIPLLLDVLIGRPEYLTRPGFRLAAYDSTTSIIYCVYMVLIPIIWRMVKKKRNNPKKINMRLSNELKLFRILRSLLPIFIIVAMSPIIMLGVSPEPKLYLTYAATALQLITGEARDFHRFIELSTLLSVFSIAITVLVVNKSKLLFALITLSPFLFISIWINGKRYIVLYSIILMLYVLWNKGVLIGARLLVIGLLMVVMFGVFSMSYQDSVRFDTSSQINGKERYENIRIDYGRDDVTKLAIYSEINPDQINILEYRGQSLLFYLSMYVPRELWEDKPFPYAKYVTSAMFLVEPKLWSWGMTTSILEEAISNFSWLGFLIGPIIVGLICRVGDKYEDPLINLLTIFVSCLILVVHLPAFAPIFLIWVMLIIYKTISKKIIF